MININKQNFDLDKIIQYITIQTIYNNTNIYNNKIYITIQYNI
jgi:hypothetical protein